MDKRLTIVLILLFAFLLLFILVIVTSEYRNINQLRKDYPDLGEEAYNLRKDSLNIWALSLLLKYLIPTLFLLSGLSYKIRLLVENDKSLFLTGLFYGIIFFTLMFIINLPLKYLSSFILRHKYGLSNQSFARWLELAIKGFLVNDLLLSPFIFIPFYIIRRNPTSWWFKLGLLVLPLIIFIIFINPIYIDPIFNKYSSLEDRNLEKGIEDLLHRAGVDDADIYVVDKSKDTKTMNAYMTGIFRSKRIVFWDTTLKNLEEGEVLSIAAHEIGHYVEKHIWKSIFLGGFGAFALLFLVYLASNWIMTISGNRFGFVSLGDLAALPLLLLILNLFSLLAMPISNYVSRYMEREADYYEIMLTEDRESAVSAMEKLYEESLGIPRPSNIYKVWYHTHPTLEERVDYYRNKTISDLDK